MRRSFTAISRYKEKKRCLIYGFHCGETESLVSDVPAFCVQLHLHITSAIAGEAEAKKAGHSAPRPFSVCLALGTLLIGYFGRGSRS